MSGHVYLDNAATSFPKPEPVHALMDRFSREIGVNPGRGGHALAADADRLVRQTRRLLAAAFGHAGSIDRVVFALNGTDALNTAIAGLTSPGDHVLTTGLEHNAVSRVLNHASHDGTLTVDAVAPDDDGYVRVEDLAAALRPTTRLLVVNHASNVIGTVQPIERIAALARERDRRLLVDASQTAGVLAYDLAALGIDALAFAGHKGLFGAMGSGVLIVAEGVELRPSRFGGTGVDSASPLQPEAYPFRLEAGTLSAPAIAGLFAAQLWFAALGERLASLGGSPPARALADAGDTLGVPLDIERALERAEASASGTHREAVLRAFAHVHAVELQRVRDIEHALRRYPRLRLLGRARDNARLATISFVVDDMAATEVAERLDADHDVCCRAGLQCAPAAHAALGTLDGGSVRLSPGYFTRDDEIARLVAGLDEIVGR